MKLPVPNPRYGHYTLSDGSRIYPSGRCHTTPGLWFAWRYQGVEKRPVHVRQSATAYCLVPVGSVLMDRLGIRYFRSPEEALYALQQEGV